MQRLFAGLGLIVILGVPVWWYREPIVIFGYQAAREVVSCRVSIPYRITSIDPRFGIATSAVEQQLKDAVDAWERIAGKDLFFEAEEGETAVIDVVFAYDERQRTTEELRVIDADITRISQEYDDLRADYDRGQRELESVQAELESRTASYNAAVARYEERVRTVKGLKNVSASQIEELSAERIRLEADRAALVRLQQDARNRVAQLNDVGRELNKVVDVINERTDTYNTVGSSNGEEYEEGVYERALLSERITVFEFESLEELQRLLIHEFGHALGMDHVKDERAIMYELNTEGDLQPNDSDIAEFRRVCSV